VFDYGRALHDVQVNAWVLAYRRLLGPALLDWQGEHQLSPPRAARQAQRPLDDAWSIEGLRDPQPRPVVPDAALQIADDGEQRSVVDVAFVAEEDAPAADVLVLLGGVAGVPAVAGQFLVGASQEVVALCLVLADKQDVGRVVVVCELGVAPP